MKESKSPLIERIRRDINSLPFIEIKKHKGEDNILYNIKIFQGEKSIIFQIKKINDFSELIYEEEYALKEFYNKNNFFRCYTTIKDIFEEFFKEFKDKEIIISKNDDKMELKFKFKSIGKMQIIEFVLSKLKLSNTKIILKLCNKIIEIEKLNIELSNKLNNINNELKEQITINKKETDDKINNQIENNKKEIDKKIKENFKKNIIVIWIVIFALVLYNFYFTRNKINDIENNKLKFFKEKIDDVEKSITEKLDDIKYIKLKSLTEKINNIENIKLDSIAEKLNNTEFPFSFQLYNSFFDIKNFKSLMNEGIKKYFKKNISNFELIYQASNDGFGYKNFHKKCDGKNNTIVLVFTDNNRIFGGFTELKWDNFSEWKIGIKGFIFSINDNKIYYSKSNYQIICRSYYEPKFKNGFQINSINNDNYGYDLTEINGDFDIKGKKYALAGQYDFTIKDYAVLRINLE